MTYLTRQDRGWDLAGVVRRAILSLVAYTWPASDETRAVPDGCTTTRT
ncbi:MAG: hypothetical protein ACRDP4_12925 [Nocardioidaceae bacterium]